MAGERQPPKLHKFHISNLPDNVTKDDIVRLIRTSSTRKNNNSRAADENDSVVVVVETIGNNNNNNNHNKRQKDSKKSFAIVSTNQSTLPLLRLQFQGQALTIQPAGGFGSSTWTRPKQTTRTHPLLKQQDQDEDRQQEINHKASDIFDEDEQAKFSSQQQDQQQDRTFPAPTTPLLPALSSLDALLADYGEHDPNWQTMRVDENNHDADDNNNDDDDDVPEPQEPSATPPLVSEPRNFLGLMGKAPIHVNIRTFGHVHGIPNDMDEAELLYDCNDYYPEQLPKCPPYLEFLDGQAGAVKRAMVTSAVRTLAKQTLANEIVQRLQQCMHIYGHANPYQMTIYIGSDSGRHRSVVLAELTATAVRQRLRNGNVDAFSCIVSVGCTHRDIQKKLRNISEKGSDKKKQKEEEDEDENEIKARRLPQRAARW